MLSLIGPQSATWQLDAECVISLEFSPDRVLALPPLAEANTRRLARAAASVLSRWNLQDDTGAPYPLTPRGLEALGQPVLLGLLAFLHRETTRRLTQLESEVNTWQQRPR